MVDCLVPIVPCFSVLHPSRSLLHVMLESLGQDGNPSKLTEMVMKVSDSYSIASHSLYIFDIYVRTYIYIFIYIYYIYVFYIYSVRS